MKYWILIGILVIVVIAIIMRQRKVIKTVNNIIHTSGLKTWNYSENFLNVVTSGQDISSVALSNDGEVQIIGVVGGRAMLSIDYGVTWTEAQTSQDIKNVAVSDNGRTIVILNTNGQLWVSNDIGHTFNPVTNLSVIDMMIDMDGEVWVLTTENISILGKNIWNQFTLKNRPQVTQTSRLLPNGQILTEGSVYGLVNGNWQIVRMVGEGNIRQVVGNTVLTNDNQYYVDGKRQQIPFMISSIAQSETGQYQVMLLMSPTDIYVSKDNGNTWEKHMNGLKSDMYELGMSGNGQYILVATRSQQILLKGN